MELMQLEMFVAVVEVGSLRGAAERVFRTQPAVSAAMSKLEREFDAPLFDRSKRYDYRLTQAGEELYRYARQMLSLRDETLTALHNLCNVRAGRLRIGANESISLHLLPQLAQAFLAAYPELRMEMKRERSATLLADLKSANLDLALVSFRPEDQSLDSAFVMRDKLVLVTRATHQFAAKGRVGIEKLGTERLLVMDISEPSPWHGKIAKALFEANSPLHPVVENAPIESIKKMVSIGLGIGFVPLMTVQQERARGELAVVDVDNLDLERSICMVWRRAALSPAAKAFLETAIAFGERREKPIRAVVHKIGAPFRPGAVLSREDR